jgi:hypothetical protein
METPTFHIRLSLHDLLRDGFIPLTTTLVIHKYALLRSPLPVHVHTPACVLSRKPIITSLCEGPNVPVWQPGLPTYF